MPSTNRTTWALSAAVYFIVTTLAHLKFSLWLVAERSTVWQGQSVSYTHRDFIPYLLPLMALAWAAWLVRSAWLQGSRSRILVGCGYWLLWLGCVAAVDRWLTYSVAEFFHYPQYALLAILLAKAIDPDRTRWPISRLLLLTTLLGALDELAQYMWITISYSHYFDFNDVLVNLLAAALGVMLYYGFRVPAPSPLRGANPPRFDRISAVLLLTVALLIAGAWAAGRLSTSPPAPVPPGGVMANTAGKPTLYLQRQSGLYGGSQPGIRHGQYHVLTPGWSLGLVAALLMLWTVWGTWPARSPSAGRVPNPHTSPAATRS